jgi:hypothetical protein
MECRGVLAYRDHRLDEVVVYASTQTPHTIRVALGEILGLEERCIRVVAPDVGGGLGPKARLYPEEIVLAASARAGSPGALDRGAQRTSADQRSHPRSSLSGNGLCRPAGQDSSASIARSPLMPGPMVCGRKAPTGGAGPGRGCKAGRPATDALNTIGAVEDVEGLAKNNTGANNNTQHHRGGRIRR